MKKSLTVLPFVCLVLVIFFSFGYSRQHPDKSTGFAVVELFTSEGCSSCPPAEEAVAALAKEYPANVYVLSFHVDYWNYLGWKDEFSSADYTQRQQQYAAVLNINSIYTPQAIVNGSTEFTGSDKKRLHAVVKDGLEKTNNSAIDISAKTSNGRDVAVSYTTSLKATSNLQIAIVQSLASSAVKRGENKGLLLHHVNIVRVLKSVASNSGTVSMRLPDGMGAGDCRIIAFIQNKSDLHITGANSCNIQ